MQSLGFRFVWADEYLNNKTLNCTGFFSEGLSAGVTPSPEPGLYSGNFPDRVVGSHQSRVLALPAGSFESVKVRILLPVIDR